MNINNNNNSKIFSFFPQQKTNKQSTIEKLNTYLQEQPDITSNIISNLIGYMAAEHNKNKKSVTNPEVYLKTIDALLLNHKMHTITKDDLIMLVTNRSTLFPKLIPETFKKFLNELAKNPNLFKLSTNGYENFLLQGNLNEIANEGLHKQLNLQQFNEKPLPSLKSSASASKSEYPKQDAIKITVNRLNTFCREKPIIASSLVVNLIGYIKAKYFMLESQIYFNRINAIIRLPSNSYGITTTNLTAWVITNYDSSDELLPDTFKTFLNKLASNDQELFKSSVFDYESFLLEKGNLDETANKILKEQLCLRLKKIPSLENLETENPETHSDEDLEEELCFSRDLQQYLKVERLERNNFKPVNYDLTKYSEADIKKIIKIQAQWRGVTVRNTNEFRNKDKQLFIDFPSKRIIIQHMLDINSYIQFSDTALIVNQANNKNYNEELHYSEEFYENHLESYQQLYYYTLAHNNPKEVDKLFKIVLQIAYKEKNMSCALLVMYFIIKLRADKRLAQTIRDNIYLGSISNRDHAFGIFVNPQTTNIELVNDLWTRYLDLCKVEGYRSKPIPWKDSQRTRGFIGPLDQYLNFLNNHPNEYLADSNNFFKEIKLTDILHDKAYDFITTWTLDEIENTPDTVETLIKKGLELMKSHN